MGFLDWIERTREKSESARYRIALVLTFLIMAIIVVVWLTISFALPSSPDKISEESPFEVVKNIFK